MEVWMDEPDGERDGEGGLLREVELKRCSPGGARVVDRVALVEAAGPGPGDS